MDPTQPVSRINPASEGELLQPERDIGPLALGRRWRILGQFCAYKEGLKIPTADLLMGRNFTGVSFVGIASSLLRQQGLHAQCLWYENDQFDWYWTRIETVENIEHRQDARFRGGLACIWLVTPLAEYAMTVPHIDYQEEWDSVLLHFQASVIDAWPHCGLRPKWWPVESSSQWPFEKQEDEVIRELTETEDVHRAIQLLSLQDKSSRQAWNRTGPDSISRAPGQRPYTLEQLQEWEVPFNAGLVLTARPLREAKDETLCDEPETVKLARGNKRKMVVRGGRSNRSKR